MCLRVLLHNHRNGFIKYKIFFDFKIIRQRKLLNPG